MYLIALVILLVAIFFITTFGLSPAAIFIIIDIPSLMIILLITLPMLLSSGLFKDFKRAFTVIMKKSVPFSKQELTRSLEAVRLTIKLILLSGVFGFLIGLISISKYAHDIAAALGRYMAVASIPIVYALFGCFILLPIQAKLKVLLLSDSSEQ